MGAHAIRGREVRLASRPTDGVATAENFEVADVDVPAPEEGQVLVENTWMSVDPYMRGRMDDVVYTSVADAEHHLAVPGMTGLTAYVALTDTAPVRPGDVVLVSAAADAVGSVAGQLARLLGASRVIGSAGGPAKPAGWSRSSGSTPRSTAPRETSPASSPSTRRAPRSGSPRAACAPRPPSSRAWRTRPTRSSACSAGRTPASCSSD